MRIIAIDPGETTGVAIHDTKTRRWETYQLQTKTDHDYSKFYYFLSDTYNGDFDVVVCERFNFRLNERSRTKIVYTPAELVGIVKLWSTLHHVKLEMQMAAEGKAFWNDFKLRRIQQYQANHPHAMDAMRHLLQYITFTEKDYYYLYMLRSTIVE